MSLSDGESGLVVTFERGFLECLRVYVTPSMLHVPPYLSVVMHLSMMACTAFLQSAEAGLLEARPNLIDHAVSLVQC